MSQDTRVEQIAKSLWSDIMKILGLPHDGNVERIVEACLRKAVHHLAEIALTFDETIADKGLPKAAELILHNWCRDIISMGGESTPTDGPLLIVSNHPGAYDALVIASKLPRPDLHIIASDLPFFHSLNNFRHRIFFIPFNKKDAAGRMAGMLSAVRYLKNGGAVLLMGSGTIDPDPAVFPGALEYLQRWTEAVNIFLRFVPKTRIQLAAVSHIVHPKWARHPITWLQRNGMEKRRLAEFGQVIQQLFDPGKLFVSPRISFSPLFSADDLGERPRDILLDKEARLLMEHCRYFGGCIP